MPRLFILALTLKLSLITLAFSLGNTEGSLALIYIFHGVIRDIQLSNQLTEVRFNQNWAISMITKQTINLNREFFAIREAIKKLTNKE